MPSAGTTEFAPVHPAPLSCGVCNRGATIVKSKPPPDRNRLAADILAMVKKHGGDEEKARHEFTMSIEGPILSLRYAVLEAVFHDLCGTGRWPTLNEEEQALAAAARQILAGEKT